MSFVWGVIAGLPIGLVLIYAVRGIDVVEKVSRGHWRIRR